MGSKAVATLVRIGTTALRKIGITDEQHAYALRSGLVLVIAALLQIARFARQKANA
jgi:hypothetical protein